MVATLVFVVKVDDVGVRAAQPVRHDVSSPLATRWPYTGLGQAAASSCLLTPVTEEAALPASSSPP